MGVKKVIRGISRLIPAHLYLRIMHYRRTKRRLSLSNPQTYTEKMQWLKLYDRNPVYQAMVDKCEAKKYVAERIGEEYIVPLLGVWDDAESIDFEALPDQFVLKCTHNSGGLVICKNKHDLNIPQVRSKIRKQLSENYYWHGREWPYKHLKPRVIAEKYMEDTVLRDLYDYKFFTFSGEPKVVHVVSNRQNAQEETYGDFFDMEYNHLNLTMGHPNAPMMPEKPHNFELMKVFAERLSKGTRHLRVDFYEVDGHLYFGELTFFMDSGCSNVQPPEWNRVIGSWISIK